MTNIKMSMLVLVAGSIMLSCGNTNKPGTEKTTSSIPIPEDNSNKGYQFKLNPALSKAYRYKSTNETISEQEINDVKTGNETSINMILSYTAVKDTSGLLNFSLRYEKFILSAKTPDQDKVIDADNAARSFDPVEKIFGAFKSATLHLTTDERGNVQNVSGLKELSDNMHQLANGNQDAIQMINTSLQQYVGSENIRSIFKKTFQLLPDSLLHEDDEWVITEPVTSEIISSTQSRYKVKSIRDGVITVTSAAEIKMIDQPITVEGTEIAASLNGNLEGEIKIEISSGMLISSSSGLKIKGKISVMGRNIPMKLRINNSTTRLNIKSERSSSP